MAELINKETNRIGSIDSVRAIVLLGIMLVHANNGFGFDLSDFHDYYPERILSKLITFLLSKKCAVVFNILFGVSFYFILKKDSYPSSKFVWRCVLLFIFGTINKLFYTYDALSWYAIWGIFLVFFRKVSPRWLLTAAIICKILLLVFERYQWGSLLFTSGTRYSFNYGICEIICYPHVYEDYLFSVLNSGVLGVLSNFLIGYWIARIGIIDSLKEKITLRLIIYLLLFYMAAMALYIPFKEFKVLTGCAAAFLYASVIIYLYYNSRLHKVLHYLESYGKLGLTNYSLQSAWGVLFVYCFRNTILVQNHFFLIFSMIMFFVFQAWYSHKWLMTHRYGPMEYLWRSLTNLNFKSNKSL